MRLRGSSRVATCAKILFCYTLVPWIIPWLWLNYSPVMAFIVMGSCEIRSVIYNWLANYKVERLTFWSILGRPGRLLTWLTAGKWRFQSAIPADSAAAPWSYFSNPCIGWRNLVARRTCVALGWNLRPRSKSREPGFDYERRNASSGSVGRRRADLSSGSDRLRDHVTVSGSRRLTATSQSCQKQFTGCDARPGRKTSPAQTFELITGQLVVFRSAGS